MASRGKHHNSKPGRRPAFSDSGRCVLYVRQSESKREGQRAGPDDDTLSLDNQEARLREHADREGWRVVAVERDLDRKGWEDDRPGLDRAIARCTSGEASVLLVYDLSRLARSARIQESIVYDLARHKARVVSLAEPQTENPLIRLVFAGMHEYRSHELARVVGDSMRRRAEAGGWLGGRAPHGYASAPRPDGRPGRILVLDESHPEHAEAVAEVFARYRDGESVPAIVRDLNRRGVTGLGGGAWSTRGVYKALDNPAYAGHTLFGEVFAADTHPAVVPPGLWEAVQARRRDGHRSRREKSCSSWLEGLVFHGCGAKMFLTVQPKPGGPTRAVFRCASNHQGLGVPCPVPRATVSKRVLEPVVLRMLLDLLGQDGLLAPRPDATHDDGEGTRRRATIARQRAKIEAERERLLDAYLSGAIPAETFRQRNAGYGERLAALDAEEAAAPPAVDRAAAVRALAAIREAREALARTADPAALARHARALATVVVDGDGVRVVPAGRLAEVLLPTPDIEPLPYTRKRG